MLVWLVLRVALCVFKIGLCAAKGLLLVLYFLVRPSQGEFFLSMGSLGTFLIFFGR